MLLTNESHPLLCPVCHERLAQTDRVLACPNNHTFDMAREGYINLLLAHQARGIVGDEKPMLRARRRVLEGGAYQPLAGVITERVAADIGAVSMPAAHIVDAGCGEGYYLGTLKESLTARFETVFTFTGVDIAKEAARLAARRWEDIRFVVADLNAGLPLPDASADFLLNIFAPRNPPDFHRVLRTGGLLLVVIPTPDHLAGLRERFGLIGVEEGKRQHIEAQFADGFALADARRLDFTLSLGGDALADLVDMTPNYWHLSDETRAALAASPPVDVQASFELLALSRR